MSGDDEALLELVKRALEAAGPTDETANQIAYAFGPQRARSGRAPAASPLSTEPAGNGQERAAAP